MVFEDVAVTLSAFARWTGSQDLAGAWSKGMRRAHDAMHCAVEGGQIMKKLAIVIGIIAAVVVAASVIALAQATLPGLVGEDVSPDGCLSCHRVTEDGRDHTMATMLQETHGRFSASRLADLAGCYTCPERRGDMAELMHAAHYAGEDNHFITRYNGYCTHCHSVDLASGAIGVKGK